MGKPRVDDIASAAGPDIIYVLNAIDRQRVDSTGQGVCESGSSTPDAVQQILHGTTLCLDR
jgi:hypothetical protein